MNEWVLYVMVAEAGETLRHFKIGISSDVDRRLPSVQTGCPLPITSVMCVRVPGKRAAKGIEGMMHWRLRDYRTSGEWFQFDLSNPAHKAAFNGAAKAAMRMHMDSPDEPWSWTVFSVADLKRRSERMTVEDREARKQARRLGIARMAVCGHRYLT